MKSIQAHQDELKIQIEVLEGTIIQKKRALAEAVEDLVATFTQDTGRAIKVESTAAIDGDGVFEIGTTAGDIST